MKEIIQNIKRLEEQHKLTRAANTKIELDLELNKLKMIHAKQIAKEIDHICKTENF